MSRHWESTENGGPITVEEIVDVIYPPLKLRSERMQRLKTWDEMPSGPKETVEDTILKLLTNSDFQLWILFWIQRGGEFPNENPSQLARKIIEEIVRRDTTFRARQEVIKLVPKK